MVRVQQKKHAAEPQVQPEQPAFPAQWCYGLYVISPVRPGFVVTVIGAMRSIIAESAPASGRRDHTISPSAASPVVFAQKRLTVLRPSHPASYVRDDRETPLISEAGRAGASS
jgi:hypothetical protein